MLSFKMACNPSIVDTRTRPAHTEARATDMLSLKVAFNPPRKMLAEISGSGYLWGYMVGWNGPRCSVNFPEECVCCISR